MKKSKVFLSAFALVAFVVTALACKTQSSGVDTHDRGSGKDGARIETPAQDYDSARELLKETGTI